jgi:hypothetical protein
MASKADGQYGGVVMMGMDYQALVVCRQGDSFELSSSRAEVPTPVGWRARRCWLRSKLPSATPFPIRLPSIWMFYLRMKVNDGLCRFAYSLDGKHYHEVGDVLKMRQGKWVGAKMGFVSERTTAKGNRGWIDADCSGWTADELA